MGNTKSSEAKAPPNVALALPLDIWVHICFVLQRPRVGANCTYDTEYADPTVYAKMILVNKMFVIQTWRARELLIRSLRGITILPNGHLHSVFDIPIVLAEDMIEDNSPIFTVVTLKMANGAVSPVRLQTPTHRAGTQLWCRNGRLSRVGAAAAVTAGGTTIWYDYGKISRVGLPAIEHSDGSKIWVVNNLHYRENDQPTVVQSDGAVGWIAMGKHHRVGGPAVILANGSTFWYLHGHRHRGGDLPASEYADGSKYWYRNGLLHRSGNLPAEICVNGRKVWAVNGWVDDTRQW